MEEKIIRIIATIIGIAILLMIPITIIVIIISICKIIKRKKENKIYKQQQPIQNYQTQQQIPNYQQQRPKQPSYQQFFPYKRKYLLTKNEYYFYKKLIPIANKYNLQILTKIRLADLVETQKYLSYTESNIYFNKIRSKHVDFALVDNMNIVLIIELDDSSHQYQSRIERDIFVDDVLRTCGYCIIHTYGDTSSIDYVANHYKNT